MSNLSPLHRQSLRRARKNNIAHELFMLVTFSWTDDKELKERFSKLNPERQEIVRELSQRWIALSADLDALVDAELDAQASAATAQEVQS